MREAREVTRVKLRHPGKGKTLTGWETLL